MGLAVFPHIKAINEGRKKAVEYYNKHIDFSKISKLKIRDKAQWNHSYYPIVFETESLLLKVQKELNEKQIFPRRYFYPSLNIINYVGITEMPISESVASRILCLPLFHDLSIEALDSICRLIFKIQNN